MRVKYDIIERKDEDGKDQFVLRASDTRSHDNWFAGYYKSRRRAEFEKRRLEFRRAHPVAYRHIRATVLFALTIIGVLTILVVGAWLALEVLPHPAMIAFVPFLVILYMQYLSDGD